MLIAWRSPDCALPDDDRRIGTMLGIGPKKWASLKPVVMAFWSLSEAGWQQKRLLKEYRWVIDKSLLNGRISREYRERKALENNKQAPSNDISNEVSPPPPPPQEKNDDDVSAGAGGRAINLDVPMPDVLAIASEAARAAGVRHASPQDIIRNAALIREWQEAGADPPTILAAIRDDRARPDAPNITSLKFFDAAIRKSVARKDAADHGYQPAIRQPGRSPAPPSGRLGAVLELLAESRAAAAADTDQSGNHGIAGRIGHAVSQG